MASFALGDMFFMVLTQIHSTLETELHIRKYTINRSNGLYPTSTCVALNKSRFATLLSYLTIINETIKKLKTPDEMKSELRCHLGSQLFLSVRNGVECVTLDHYYIPTGQTKLLPCNDGVTLTINQWDKFVGYLETVKNISTEFRYAMPCFMDERHCHIKKCPECHPFGYFHRNSSNLKTTMHYIN